MTRSLTRAPLIVLVSVLAGVLTAGLGLPVVGAAGLVARAGTDTFDSLPQELTTPPLPQVSTLLASDGSVLARVFQENRVSVPLDRVPQVARGAVLSIEDSRFYDHNGVDLRGLARAFVTNQRAGEVRQGGSTLTQQYVKNVLLTSAETEEEQQAAIEQSAARKAREARLALAVEEQLSKDEILERYLNIAYFGAGAYGIGTASQRYFSKPVEELTLAESALLAGLVQSPSAYDPLRNPARAKERRDTVLRRMAELGTVPQADVDAALATELDLNPSAPQNGCVTSPWPFFCDWVMQQVVPNEPALGATPEDRVSRLLTGGLTVRTTIQPPLQQAADEAISRADRDERAGATVMIEPGTGNVLALAVSEPYGEDTAAGQTTFPLATAGPEQNSGFQPGSTFKVFGIVAALEAGIPVGQAINSPARYRTDRCDPTASGYFQNYAESAAGRIDLRRATARSTNTYFIQIAERIGSTTIARTAERLGVTGLPLDEIGDRSCAIVLGTEEVSVLSMANAYATLASGGVRCQPRGILEITDSSGAPLPVSPPGCERVLDERIAATTTDLLTGVIRNGTGTGAAIGRPAAGKTGTTNNSYAAWFAGYTPQLASAVWVGYPRELRDTGLTGGSLPATIWSQQMRRALQGQPVLGFPRAAPQTARGKVEVPDVVGMSVSDAQEAIEDAGLDPSVSSRRTRSSVREGAVAAQTPRPGRTVRVGSTVQVVRSRGR
jgi:membrane peptidoglycan carboxypeptidase